MWVRMLVLLWEAVGPSSWPCQGTFRISKRQASLLNSHGNGHKKDWREDRRAAC